MLIKYNDPSCNFHFRIHQTLGVIQTLFRLVQHKIQSTMNFDWKVCHDDTTKRTVLQDLLPQEHSYKITSYELKSKSQIIEESKFSAKLFVNISDEDSAISFIKEFQEITGTSYNYKASSKDQKDTVTLQWSGARKCIHNVNKFKKHNSEDLRDENQKGKHTGCEANLSFKLFKDEKKKNAPFNFMIILHYNHNHSIKSSASSKFQSVSQQTVDAFQELFRKGFSASKAYAEFKKELKEAHSEADYIQIAANNNILPSYRWCFHQHSIFMENAFGKINSIEAYQIALKMVEDYNAKNGAELCSLKQTDAGEFYLACVDPLCLRIHDVLPQAGDILFVDATSNLDR